MKKHNAFTMIELIVVIVVLGILAAYSIPRIKRDTRAEAIEHMLTMIRYTQNLALHDSKHKRDDSKWQRGYWRLKINQCYNGGLYYIIGTDDDVNGGIDRYEAAIDPSNGKQTFWISLKPCPKNSTDALNRDVSPNIFITQRYGINKVSFKCKRYKDSAKYTTVKHIGFDDFGRPYVSNTDVNTPAHKGVAVDDCSIKFEFEDSSIDSFKIIIPNETGFAYLKENPKL